MWVRRRRWLQQNALGVGRLGVGLRLASRSSLQLRPQRLRELGATWCAHARADCGGKAALVRVEAELLHAQERPHTKVPATLASVRVQELVMRCERGFHLAAPHLLQALPRQSKHAAIGELAGRTHQILSRQASSACAELREQAAELTLVRLGQHAERPPLRARPVRAHGALSDEPAGRCGDAPGHEQVAEAV